MGGGLMQLVAYGAQDIYLTGNPQITFFKVVTADTNFSMESLSKPSTELLTSVSVLQALFLEMQIGQPCIFTSHSSICRIYNELLLVQMGQPHWPCSHQAS